MSQGSSSTTVGQEIDFPRFKVQLVDSAGQVKDRIGYWFYEAGALTAANGWNKLSAEERNGLTAEIQPFDSEATSEAASVDSETASQEEEPADGEPEIDEWDGRYVVVLNECGTYFVVDLLLDDDQALQFVRSWKQKTSRAIIVDAMEIGSLEKLAKLSDPDPSADDANEVGNGSSYVNELGKGVQRLLVGHLEHVLAVVREPGAIVHQADIGVVAKSFKRLAAQCTDLDIPSKGYDPERWDWDSDCFDRAMAGDYKHERLELALGSIMDQALPEASEEAEEVRS